MNIKLSDTHLVILSAAAAREDKSVLPIPESVKARGKVLDAVLKKLLRLELIEVCELGTGDPGWNGIDQNSSPTGFRLADKGFKALDILPECGNDQEEQEIAKDADDDGPRCVECGAKAESGKDV